MIWQNIFCLEEGKRLFVGEDGADLALDEERGEGEAGGVGAGEAFGDGGAEATEVVYPVGGYGTVGGAPVHGDGLEDMVTGRIEVALVYQLRAVECIIVVLEGHVIGLAEEAVGAGDDGGSVERSRHAVSLYKRGKRAESRNWAACNAECRCGVNDVETVADTLHQGHMGVLSCRLLHRQTHAAGVAHKQQVAALQTLPLGCSATCQSKE